MDYPIRFADQLRSHLQGLRKQRGLTQAELGERLGVGQARVAEIESKPGVVGIEQLLKVLATLGVSLYIKDEAEDTLAAAMAPKAATNSGTIGMATTIRPKAGNATKPGKPTPPIIPTRRGSW